MFNYNKFEYKQIIFWLSGMDSFEKEIKKPHTSATQNRINSPYNAVCWLYSNEYIPQMVYQPWFHWNYDLIDVNTGFGVNFRETSMTSKAF